MATIKDIKRTKNRGIRPTNNVILAGHIWLVEKGQPYDLVQFSINELNKPYLWRECICVPCDWEDETIERVVRGYAEDEITEKDIKDYVWFLECGEKWGWD